MLDAEVLFDPLEKQFDLPTLFVKRGDGFRREHEIVCQKHEALAGFRIAKRDAPHVLRIVLSRVKSIERDALIRADAGCFIDRAGIDAVIIHVAFGARDEERTRPMKHISRLKST